LAESDEGNRRVRRLVELAARATERLPRWRQTTSLTLR
jgi:hypothetical protein